jgi:heptosyltransferase III
MHHGHAGLRSGCRSLELAVYYSINRDDTGCLSKQRRILVVRTDRLGDVVLTLPMLPLLREWYPDAYLAMLLSRYTGEIVEGNPSLDAIIWDDAGGQTKPVGRFVQEIRSHRFSTVFVVHPTARLAWLVARAGIPERIGTGYRAYSFLFTRRIFEHRKDARFHELEYNLHQLRAIRPEFSAGGIVPRFDICIDPQAAAKVRSVLVDTPPARPLIILHPGSGGSAKDWPVESFVRLASALASGDQYRLAVTGGKSEQTLVEAVAAAGKTALVFPGTLTLPELAALCAEAKVMVANSTGPLHLAAAVGSRVVGLYPQLTGLGPARWGPYTPRRRVFVPSKPVDCRDCGTGGPCACMASIPVDHVLHAVKDLANE